MNRPLEFSADSPEAFNLSLIDSSFTMRVYAHEENGEDVVILGSQNLGEYKQAGLVVPISLGVEQCKDGNMRHIRITRADHDKRARDRGIQARITPTLDTPFRYWTMFTVPQTCIDLTQSAPRAPWSVASDPEVIYGIDSAKIFVNVVAREAVTKQSRLRRLDQQNNK